MLGYVLIGTLAAFGLMCAVWILWGLFLPGRAKGYVLYAGEDVLFAAQRYLWLREMGLIHCPLLVLEPDACHREWLEAQGIEICSRSAMAQRLGIGAEEN